MMALERSRVALVTGAGSGIGRAIAERLARDGERVAVNDLRGADAEEVVAGIKEYGGEAASAPGDVSDAEAVRRIVEAAQGAFGPVEILVNNAGYGQQKLFVDLTVEDFDRMIGVHLRGTFLCTSAVLPEMLSRGRGVIVNVASQLGQIGGVELCHYSAAKAGIIGLTKSLARELASRGVRANAIAPGYIGTALTDVLPEDVQQAILANTPLGRLGTPEDVAGAVRFLCSDEASFVTGEVLLVDGGLGM
jgi:3-oxoacyl-[acyl-carrier protein] reductase